MFGGGENNYFISWTGSSPYIFREYMTPLFSDLREGEIRDWDNNNKYRTNILTYTKLLILPWYNCCGCGSSDGCGGKKDNTSFILF